MICHTFTMILNELAREHSKGRSWNWGLRWETATRKTAAQVKFCNWMSYPAVVGITFYSARSFLAVDSLKAAEDDKLPRLILILLQPC